MNDSGQKIHEDKWHIGYNGPRCVLLHMNGLPNGMALIEFHNSLELVKAADLYDDEAACYTGAWLAELERTSASMRQASAYKERADKLRKEASK